MRKAWSRLDTGLATLLGGAALLSRWMLRGHDLFSYDSGLLAAGMLDYDFGRFHPHAPFYALTIGLANLLSPWVGAVSALILLSVLASGVMAFATYAVGRELGGPRIGFVAAALVVLSPTALFNGSVALSYSLEGAASAVLGWLAWQARRKPSWQRAAGLGVAASLAVGLRPSMAILLVPLVLWATLPDWRRVGVAVAAGAAATLAWLVPAIAIGGGLRLFLAGNAWLSRHAILADTVLQGGWPSVRAHLHDLASYLPSELPLLGAVLVLAAITALAWVPRVRRREGTFLATWIVPPVAFYAFIYSGWPIFPSGYAMVLVPAGAVLVAWLLNHVWLGVREQQSSVGTSSATLAVMVILAIPLAWPGHWEPTMSGQRSRDAWSAQWDRLEALYPPNETALLTYWGWGWAWVDHPEYLSWFAEPYWNATGATLVQVLQEQHRVQDKGYFTNVLDGDLDAPHAVPTWVRHIVVFEPPGVGIVTLRHGLGQNFTVAPGFEVRVLGPQDLAGLRYIEGAMPWFDEAGARVL